MELTDISYIQKLLEKYGFKFSKNLGQNFLINPVVCPQMAESAKAEYILEIGPGFGVLTKELSKVAKKVVAVELDSRLIPVLKETLADCSNVEVVNADILKTDISSLFPKDAQISVCANLPYYITTPILMYLLESDFNISNITVMVQKETADRLCAHLGTRECGAISGAIEYYSEAKKLFDVKASSFIPAPKVDSSVISLKVKKKEKNKKLFTLIRAAFAERRKTAINSISGRLNISKIELKQNFADIGVDINSRAENITLDQYINLCKDIKL